MARRDWDDDSWYDDDEFPPLRPQSVHGGVVTVAVISFIMCGFNALCSTCFLFCGLVASAFNNANQANGGFLPGDWVRHAALILLFFGLTSGVSFVLQIIAGIGLLNRRRWARSVSFFLAGFSLVIAVILGFFIVKSLAQPNMDDELMGGLVFEFIGVIFHLGYALTVFLVLLNRRVARSLY